MKRHKLAMLFAFIWFNASADELELNTKLEISHLLNFVAISGCQYERNGDFHEALAAKKHIEKKFRYYQDKIASAEQFIQLSATKSTMSGKPYFIHCPGKPKMKSATWLLNELRRLREQS